MHKFWEEDRLQNIIITEFLRRGGKILAEEPGAVLVEDGMSGVICLSATSEDDGRKALEARESYELLISSQPLMVEYLGERYGLKCEHPCFQGVYTKGTPLPLAGRLEISLANDEEAEKVLATYQFADPEEIMSVRERKMLFAAHADGQFCGYIGEHSEGSMGMLHIFPEFRGRGYAAELESFMINKKLGLGCVPYCHIIYDNAASLHLQKKLGLEIAKEQIFWMHKA